MPNPLKQITKRGLQHIAARFGRHTRTPHEPELAILMYHRILPQDDSRARLEEPGMIVTPQTFRLHMRLLQQYFTVISLSQWIKQKANGEPLPERCVAITFDDGWADNYEFAYPILKQLSIPATIFLVSAMMDSNQQFWPERLAQLLATIAKHHPDKWQRPELQWITNTHTHYSFNHLPPDQEQLSEIIAQIKQLTDNDIHMRIDTIENLLQLKTNASPDLLSWQQLAEMCASGLIEAGSHTCHHIRLNDTQTEATQMAEISQSKSQIEQHLSQAVTAFCYPNGDYSDFAVDQVAKLYDCAVTTNADWNTIKTNPYLLNRIGLHEDISADKTAFLARLSCWL